MTQIEKIYPLFKRHISSMDSDIDSVDVSLHVHATEDAKKVLLAIYSTLGIKPEMFSQRRMEGHFGNMIISCNTRLKGVEASKLIKKVMENLDSLGKEEIRLTLDKRLEDNQFIHLRLDKQELVKGRVRLGESDPVKLRIRLSGKVRDIRKMKEVLFI